MKKKVRAQAGEAIKKKMTGELGERTPQKKEEQQQNNGNAEMGTKALSIEVPASMPEEISQTKVDVSSPKARSKVASPDAEITSPTSPKDNLNTTFSKVTDGPTSPVAVDVTSPRVRKRTVFSQRKEAGKRQTSPDVPVDVKKQQEPVTTQNSILSINPMDDPELKKLFG